MTKPAMQILVDAGIDDICGWLVSGVSQTKIAQNLGVSPATLATWFSSDIERSARAREARILAASAHVDKAEQVLTDAADPFELAKARELASHYRWKASKSDPRGFGDKIEIDQKTTIISQTDEQINDRIRQLSTKVSED
jgi:transcriptional regulator with XRE-family HTH domain